jgi:ubiquitin carboxyl-terminal hydrolase 16
MPEKPLTIATYAAGASLAAITLVYVFGPTFFLDDDAANTSKSSRKKGVVGLVNPANDCFINSVLQALAGLPDLRAFLIREVHRRKLDGPQLYNDLTAALEEKGKKSPEWKVIGLQQGLVTAGLKEVLDALNERPIYKKTISAQNFIRCVEQAFRTRVSRTQQDAQEFLQVVVERLAEEYRAGERVRRRAHRSAMGITSNAPTEREHLKTTSASDGPRDSVMMSSVEDEKEAAIFPLEGKLESQVECLHCHFKPKPSVSTFLTLTLNVPYQQTSATLNECFDGMFKLEHIDDFKCDRCRLEHAVSINERVLAKSNLSAQERAAIEVDTGKLREAIRTDPEKPPAHVQLPELHAAPKRKIARHTRISTFPKILSIHLSRSLWDASASSSKNTAKISFPESLPLGSLLDRKTYRLLGVVTHKGGHNSGHYESFRRQVLPTPFSTPTNMGREGVFSLRSSPAPSTVNSPQLSARTSKDDTSPILDSSSSPATSHSTGTPTSPSPWADSSTSFMPHPMASTPSAEKRKSANHGGTGNQDHIPFEAVPTPGLPDLPRAHSPVPVSGVDRLDEANPKRSSTASLKHLRRSVTKKKAGGGSDRWWRISDDKVKESKTSDVLAMQKEVYLLFYEMVGA